MLFRGLKASGEKNGRPGLSSPAQQNTRNTETPLRLFQQRPCISSIVLWSTYLTFSRRRLSTRPVMKRGAAPIRNRSRESFQGVGTVPSSAL